MEQNLEKGIKNIENMEQNLKKGVKNMEQNIELEVNENIE